MFQLLVEEKTGAEKNAKFDQDFKTLADVLIQETVKNEVGKVLPQLQDNILGEESNKFTNKLGNSLTVEIKETSEGTKELLVKVLDNNETAAKLLADQVNSPNLFFLLKNKYFPITRCTLMCLWTQLSLRVKILI